jgi:hypothetical protein
MDAYKIIEKAWQNLRACRRFEARGQGACFYESAENPGSAPLSPLNFNLCIEYRNPMELNIETMNTTGNGKDYKAKLLPNTLLATTVDRAAPKVYNPSPFNFSNRFAQGSYNEFLEYWFFLIGREESANLYKSRHRFLIEDEAKTKDLTMAKELKKHLATTPEQYYWMVGTSEYQREQILVIDKQDFAVTGIAQRIYQQQIPGWLKFVPSPASRYNSPLFEGCAYYSSFLAMQWHRFED